MSKGFDWCVARAKDPSASGLTDRDWAKAYEFVSELVFSSVSKELTSASDIDFSIGEDFYTVSLTDVFGNNRTIKIHTDFQPDGDFDYFTCDGCVCDGTLAFMHERIENIAAKVLTLGTADKRYVGKDFTEVWWTVGNFVCLEECSYEFAPEDKPWMKDRITVLLPLRMEVK